MSELLTNEARDKRVLELYERVLEIEQRLIPTGLHVFGRPSERREVADLLRMVASFDRPELGVRALTDLVAAGLNLDPYSSLLNQSAGSEQRMAERERVEEIVREAIDAFLEGSEDQAAPR